VVGDGMNARAVAEEAGKKPQPGGSTPPPSPTPTTAGAAAFSAEWCASHVLRLRADGCGWHAWQAPPSQCFPPSSAGRKWRRKHPIDPAVHRLRVPLFAPAFAAAAIEAAETHARSVRTATTATASTTSAAAATTSAAAAPTAAAAAATALGGWCTRRHRKYATCDLPVGDVAGLAGEGSALAALVEGELLPAIAGMYGLRREGLSLRDCFVVKYDAGEGEGEGGGGGEGGAGGAGAGGVGQRALAMHEDRSELSFNALLSDPAGFAGGGTRFEGLFGGAAVQVGRGEVLVHAGALRHEGVTITRGQRYLMVGFIRYCKIDGSPW
jgi:hypothetical protein